MRASTASPLRITSKPVVCSRQRLLDRVGDCAFVVRHARNVHERRGEIDGVGMQIEETHVSRLGAATSAPPTGRNARMITIGLTGQEACRRLA